MPLRLHCGCLVGCLTCALGCARSSDYSEPNSSLSLKKIDAAQPVSKTASPAPPLLTEEPTPAKPLVAKAALRPATGQNGDTMEFIIEAKTAGGWHIYATGEAVRMGTPTTVEIILPKGLEPAGRWQFPKAVPGPEKQGGIYEGRLLFRRLLRITGKAKSGPVRVQCRLTYQACDAFRCQPPQTLTLSAEGEVGPTR